MKEIKKEIITYATAYISVDGKEFETADACLEWENSYRRTIESSWETIPKKKVYDSDFGIPYAADDHECYTLKPKNLDEIVLINAYIKATTGDDGTLTTEHISKVILLNFGYDHEYCDIDILSDHLRAITERIENIQKEFEET